MRRSKSYEVRDTMNIWNKYDFAMSGLGKKRKILALPVFTVEKPIIC